MTRLARGVIALLTFVAGCSRRDDAARAVPVKELARPTPSVPPAPRCDPACEAGAVCVEGLCAETIDWASRALQSAASCPLGQRHAVSCAKTAKAAGSVWGTDVYTTDSAICVAAVHAGKLAPSGGEVIYEFRPGLSSYVGSKRNGLNTNSWGAYDCSFVFTSKGCYPGSASCGAACADLQSDPAHCGSCGVACAVGEGCRKGVCSLGLDADYATAPGEPCTGARTYVCPPLAGATVGSVWGTTVYTNDSSVCGAAVHAGAIAAAAGGTVTIEMMPGLPAYVGSTHHGIVSAPWAAWSCSFRFK